MPIFSLSRVFINVGIFLIIIGIVIKVAGKLGINKLPGDIVIKGENFSFYFPIVTCIVISIVLSFIFNFLKKL